MFRPRTAISRSRTLDAIAKPHENLVLGLAPCFSSVNTQSPSSKAIFVSYASQDAEAARRIADALQQGGIEVWFDQSQLRGGEAWDASIRRQIKSCKLFLAVISASTQAREEGYFRREWNLAVGRTMDMADDTAFLLPVVIDATTDVEARVPEKFREVQWTRLPGGETPARFDTYLGPTR
jgi:hypothetical protein